MISRTKLVQACIDNLKTMQASERISVEEAQMLGKVISELETVADEIAKATKRERYETIAQVVLRISYWLLLKALGLPGGDEG